MTVHTNLKPDRFIFILSNTLSYNQIEIQCSGALIVYQCKFQSRQCSFWGDDRNRSLKSVFDVFILYSTIKVIVKIQYFITVVLQYMSISVILNTVFVIFSSSVRSWKSDFQSYIRVIWGNYMNVI